MLQPISIVLQALYRFNSQRFIASAPFATVCHLPGFSTKEHSALGLAGSALPRNPDRNTAIQSSKGEFGHDAMQSTSAAGRMHAKKRKRPEMRYPPHVVGRRKASDAF